MALGFLFFTRREQVVRMIQRQRHISYDKAKQLKKLGGLFFEDMKDFAVSDKYAYNFNRVAKFDQSCI